MIYIIVWLAFAGIAGYMASNRNRSGLVWFLLSIILSPIICIIALLVIGKNKTVLTEDGIKKLKDAVTEFNTLYCENEGLLSQNSMLKDAFAKFSELTVNKETTLTAEEVYRYTDRLMNSLPNATNTEIHKVSTVENLEKLKSLLDSGAIDLEEYNTEKSKILGTT